MAIPGIYNQLWTILTKACDEGDLALVQCRDAHTGEPRYVVCAIDVKGDGNADIYPLGHLVPNGCEVYVDPDTCQRLDQVDPRSDIGEAIDELIEGATIN